MTRIDNAILPRGSLILVTGANGFIASHIVEQLLELGYKVRGTARSLSKLHNLKERWDDKYPGLFEAAEVPDIIKEGAYDEAIKDVAGVAHVAMNMSFSLDYDAVVRDAVDSTLVALKASRAAPSVKRFVLTSSVTAITTLEAARQEHLTVGENDFNYKAIELAQTLGDDDPTKGAYIYAAAKTQGELAAWKYIKENKPSFDFSSVQPGYCIGEILDPVSQSGSTAGWVRDLFLGKSDAALKLVPDVNFAPVTDVARLHIGALLLPSVKNQRLFGSPHAGNWNDILSIFRKNYPTKTFYDDVKDCPPCFQIYDIERSTEVLKEIGQDTWKPLEQAIVENVRPFA